MSTTTITPNTIIRNDCTCFVIAFLLPLVRKSFKTSLLSLQNSREFKKNI